MYIISISFTQFSKQPNTISTNKTSNMLKTTKLITNSRKPTKDFTFSSSSKSCKRLHSNNLFHKDGATWGPKGTMAPAGSKKKKKKLE
jgi:hypothetical protein